MKSSLKVFGVFGLIGISTALLVGAYLNTPSKHKTEAKETSADWNNPYTGSYEGTYYNSVTESQGMPLKNKLHSIISNGFVSVGYDGLFNVYPDSDARPDDGTLFDNYGDIHFPVNNKRCGSYGAVGDCWNREHSIPKSWWGGAKNNMYSDAHHLLPTDGYINNWRSNYALGEVVTPTSGKVYSFQNDIEGVAKLGKDSGGATVFEPADCYKGDMARIYFYFATKWEDAATSGDGAKVFTSSTTNCHLTAAAKEMFLRWHRADPVSIKEVKRNEGVFKHQKNRNPFVDHPEYVEAIWGDTPLSSNSVTLSKTSITMSSDGSGVQINAKSSDNSTISWKSNNTSIATVSSASSNSGANITINPVNAGTTTVTASATIDGHVYSSSCNVIVTKTISTLSYTGSPTKTNYFEGDSFNPSGLTVKAKYTDNSEEEVTNLVTWTPDPLTEGTTQVTGTYGGKSITVNSITVQKKQASSISLTNSDFTSSYDTTAKQFTKGEVSLTRCYVMDQSNKIQFKKGQGYLYNNDALNLVSITLTTASSSMRVYGGNSKNPTTTQLTGSSGVYDLSSYSYFRIDCSSDVVGTVSKIDIEISSVTPELESIAVSNAKTSYLTGASFVKPTVTATYTTGSTKDVTNSAVFSGYNMSTAGEYTVSVSYTENEITKSTSYGITVEDPIVVTSLTATGTPTKTTYFVGDSFNSTGLTITAHFSDGSDDVVTEETQWSPDPLTAGTTSVTGTYEDKTVVISGIIVNEIQLQSISTTGQKTEYSRGATFAYNGQCLAHYNNGSTKYVTPAVDSSNVNMNVLGTYTINLSYTDSGITKTTSYQITVSEAPFVNSIEQCYSLNKGDNAGTVYGLYVGYVISGTNADHHAIIMNGEYGIELYRQTPEASWEAGKTYLKVSAAKLDIFNNLYELAPINTSSGYTWEVISGDEVTNNVEPISTYNVTGNEKSTDYVLANRLSIITGVVTDINNNSSWKDSADNTVIITTENNNTITLFVKASMASSAKADITGSKTNGTQLLVRGFTSFSSSGFQVQYVDIVKADASYKAKDFAQDLLDLTDSICASSANKEGDLSGVWAILQTDHWLRLSDDEKATLLNISADESGTVAQQAMARYDVICRKYASCINFIGRMSANKASNSVIKTTNNNMFVLVSAISATIITSAILAYFALKKKKQY